MTAITENNTIKDARKQFSRIGLVLFLGTILITLVNILSSYIISNIPAVAESANLSFLVSMLSGYVFAFSCIFLMFRKIPVQLSGEKKKLSPFHLLGFYLICHAGTYICNLIATLITAVIGVIKQSPVDNVLLDMVSNIDPMVNLFVVVICAPVMEELLFRKMLIDRTSDYGDGVSIVFSGLLFGLFHGNLVQFSYAFFIGICFGFIYIKTRSILYPIILHMLTNFMGSFVGMFILEKSGFLKIMETLSVNTTDAEIVAAMLENLPGFLIYISYALFIFAMVLFGIVLFFSNRKKFILSPGKVVIEKGQRFKTVFLNPGVILCSIIYIVTIILQLLA